MCTNADRTHLLVGNDSNMFVRFGGWETGFPASPPENYSISILRSHSDPVMIPL